MKLSPMGISFLSAFLLSTTTFAEEITEDHLEDLFSDSATETPEGYLHTLGFVLFDKNESKFNTANDTIISEVAALVLADPRMKIELSGHTDNGGSDELNEKLAQARAETVRTVLIEKGIAADRITAISYGKDRPLADNDSEEGKVLNRQVTIWGIIK